jgi:citrate lyase subunit beta/citryl-CoA lyase
VIHPKHVEVVNAVFTPTGDERAWAERVVAAFAASPESGVVRLDDKMVDKPHLVAARRLLGLDRSAGAL